MALPSSGPISFNDLATQFGGTQPILLSQYYRGGGLVPDIPPNSGIPTSGEISLNQFHGAASQLNTQTFTSAGTFTVPTNVTLLTITVIGGGGGSGGSYLDTGLNAYSGGAGSPGYSVSGNLSVTAGQVYTISPGTGGIFGGDRSYGGTGGNGGTGYNNGTQGTSLTYGGGGGGGASSAVVLSGTPVIVASGGAGGNASVGLPGGTGGAGGGSNVVPSGFTATSAANGGAGSSVAYVFSGSYPPGGGSGYLSSIHDTIQNSYPYLASTLGSVSGGGNDWNFPMTLSVGTYLVASGGNGAYTNPSYEAPYTTLNSGFFTTGKTVTGINFSSGATQGNGSSSYYFYNGFAYNSGGNGSVVIQYYT